MTYIRYPFRLNLKNCNALHAVIEHTRFSPGNIYWRLFIFLLHWEIFLKKSI